MRSAFFIGAAVLVVAAVHAAPAGKPFVPPWGVDLGYIDKSVKPGDDFFRYTNGTWLKTATIPGNRTYSGINLEIDLRNEAHLKQLVDDLVKTPDNKLDPEQKKLHDLYLAFMDTAQIEANGLKPAQKDLAYIAGLKTLSDVARAMGDPSLGLDGPFSDSIGVDDKNSNAYSISLGQSGLGMPDRDYYLKNDKDIAATREAYKKYLAQMLAIAGYKDAPARAARVYALELAMAQVSWAAADRRDEDKIYNPMTIAELKTLAPGFDWDALFASAGIPEKSPLGDRKVIVAEKSAFPALAHVFAATPVAVWRDYLTVSYLHAWAAFLPRKVDDTNFGFYGKALGGADRPARPRHPRHQPAGQRDG